MSKARKVERTTKTQIEETNEPNTGLRNVTSSIEMQECSEITEKLPSARSAQQSCPRPSTSGGANRTNTRPLQCSPASTTMNRGFFNERSPNRTPPRNDRTQIFGTPRTPTKPFPGPPMFTSTPNRAGGKRPELSLGGNPSYGDRLFGAEAPGDYSMPEVPDPVCIREEDQDMAAGLAMFDTTPKDFGHVHLFENDYSPLPRSPDKFDFTMIDTSYGSMYLPDRLMRGPRSPKSSGPVCQAGPARGTYEPPQRGTYSAPPRGTYTTQPRQQAPRGTYTPPQNAVCPRPPPRGTYSPPQRAPPRGTYTPPQRDTCPAPPRGTYSPPQRGPGPAPPRGTYCPAQLDATTYGSIPGYDDYSYKSSYNFTSPPQLTLASEVVPPPSSIGDNDSSFLPEECKRPPPGSYAHAFGSAYEDVFGKNAMNDTMPIIQRPDTSYEQMFSQRFPGHRPDQAMAMHSTQINEDVNLSRYDRPDFTREQMDGNYQTPNNQEMDQTPVDSGNYEKIYKMGSFTLHDSDVPSKMLSGISRKSVRISEADYDPTGPICETDFSIDGDISSVQSDSLLQSFDKKVKYELSKLSRQFEGVSPSRASSQRSTSVGDSSVSGHVGTKKHRPEMLRASGTAISIASAMRDCVDTDLLHVIDGFALAEAMCEYDAQVQAADEAAESVPIEMAEEAAIEGARNFRKEADGKGFSKLESGPQELISIVAYVGSTRPAYNIKGFKG